MKCQHCGAQLSRVTTGNIIDYRHPGGETLCMPAPLREEVVFDMGSILEFAF